MVPRRGPIADRQQIDDLFYMILIIVTIVFIGVEVALGYVLWRGARDTEAPGKAMFSHGSHASR